MKRFYFNNDDDEDDYNIYDEDAELNDEEMATAYAFIDEGDIAHAIQLDLAETELDQELMKMAIEIASNSWFWKFKNHKNKMSEIGFVYKELKRIRDEGNELKEEE